MELRGVRLRTKVAAGRPCARQVWDGQELQEDIVVKSPLECLKRGQRSALQCRGLRPRPTVSFYCTDANWYEHMSSLVQAERPDRS